MTRLVTSGRGSVFGFPNKLITCLRYVDTVPVVSTSGGLAKQVFRLNSTFDPDFTNTGHQPLFRDTYAAIFDQYAVVETKVKMTFVNSSAQPQQIGLVVEDDSTSSSNYNTLMEQNNAQHALTPALTGSISSRTFSLFWSCKKMLGIDPYASETYKTAVGSNPTEESYLILWSQPIDLASTTTCYWQIELDYKVVFSELATPTGS
jgi:hypothetical protein